MFKESETFSFILHKTVWHDRTFSNQIVEWLLESVLKQILIKILDNLQVGRSSVFFLTWHLFFSALLFFKFS